MKFVRYIAVQVLAYGLDMGGFLIVFDYFGAGPIIANIVGKIVAGIFAFFVHRSFTFVVSREGRKTRQAAMYFLLLALNVPISSVVLSIVLMAITQPVFAKFIADVIFVIVTYWISKKFVFSDRCKKLHSIAQGSDII
ncbi:GtrA family protein [Desulfopila sp. IMCC35006]|uniref:GtrA family protein n=1 Tax=Desulfopila sp. IMCC35006 TaxID=2569542 RepID=UPI0010AC61BD|nr:GtrA family protein [Desulfopila sp. IMCC35006]TKB26117.1 GtrA family protein [Desulfopila sp. IMCC35006]